MVCLFLLSDPHRALVGVAHGHRPDLQAAHLRRYLGGDRHVHIASHIDVTNSHIH